MKNDELSEWLDRFDRELIDAVASEIREHVAKLDARGDEFYGYAILPGDTYSIENLVAAYNRESDVKPENINDAYFRYSVDEWANYEHGEFPTSSQIIESRNSYFNEIHVKDDKDFVLDQMEIAHIGNLLNSILKAMTELQTEGLIGGDACFAAVWIPDSGHSIICESVRALNSHEIYEEFIAEFGD